MQRRPAAADRTPSAVPRPLLHRAPRDGSGGPTGLRPPDLLLAGPWGEDTFAWPGNLLRPNPTADPAGVPRGTGSCLLFARGTSHWHLSSRWPAESCPPPPPRPQRIPSGTSE